MTTTTAPNRHHRLRPVMYSLGFAALWIVAAAWRPSLTFHLAPILVAGVPALFAAIDKESPSDEGHVAAAAMIGMVLAAITTAAISLAGWMRGPTLLPFGGPAVEALVFAVGGGIAGWGFGRLRRS